VVGETSSTDLPTVRALQPSNAGGFDAFVAKIEPAGASLAYATYLGGSGLDGATALAVDGSGSAVVTGFTDSADFPSANALQRSFGGGSFDAFATRLDASGAALVYATYLGGGDTDAGFGVAVDAAGTVRVMGQTVSRDFPTSHAAQQEFGGGASDVFLSAIAPSGPTIARASLRRRRLVVTGEGFDSGATLFVDGVSVRTRNDPRSPTTSLRARAGHIGRGQTVRLVVRNASGAVSPEFRFTRD
jgi:hypothetical protein